MKNRNAIYAGSFDPFTNGHLAIVEKSSEIFDNIIIGIAHNNKKQRNTDINTMRDAIERQTLNFKNVSVVIIDKLIADYCKENGIYYLVRGLRNTTDYLYEENIAKINNEINPNLRTIYFRADNDAISSSMIRELIKYNKDVSKYVPEEIYKIIQLE